MDIHLIELLTLFFAVMSFMYFIRKDTKEFLDKFSKETKKFHDETSKETKEFHGRICKLEERYYQLMQRFLEKK